MHNKLPEKLNDEYFNSDRHRELWNVIYPKKKSILKRVLAFVKNNV